MSTSKDVAVVFEKSWLFVIKTQAILFLVIAKKLAEECFYIRGHNLNFLYSTHVLIKIVDTDVVIIAVALFPDLELEELWIEFGSDLNKMKISIHVIY